MKVNRVALRVIWILAVMILVSCGGQDAPAPNLYEVAVLDDNYVDSDAGYATPSDGNEGPIQTDRSSEFSVEFNYEGIGDRKLIMCVKPNEALGDELTRYVHNVNYMDFAGWYLERDFKTKVEEGYKVTQNIVLYAKYVPKGYGLTSTYDGAEIIFKVDRDDIEEPKPIQFKPSDARWSVYVKKEDLPTLTYTENGVKYYGAWLLFDYSDEKWEMVDGNIEIHVSGKEKRVLKIDWRKEITITYKLNESAVAILPSSTKAPAPLKCASGVPISQAELEKLNAPKYMEYGWTTEDVAKILAEDLSERTIARSKKNGPYSNLVFDEDATIVPYWTHDLGIGEMITKDGSRIEYSDIKNYVYDATNPPVAIIWKSSDWNRGVSARGVSVANADSDIVFANKNTSGYDLYVDELANLKCGEGAWNLIKQADPSGAANPSINYPAYNWVNTFAADYNSFISDGWYLPASDEVLSLACVSYDGLGKSAQKAKAKYGFFVNDVNGVVNGSFNAVAESWTNFMTCHLLTNNEIEIISFLDYGSNGKMVNLGTVYYSSKNKRDNVDSLRIYHWGLLNSSSIYNSGIKELNDNTPATVADKPMIVGFRKF